MTCSGRAKSFNFNFNLAHNDFNIFRHLKNLFHYDNEIKQATECWVVSGQHAVRILWWSKEHCSTSSTTHNVSRQSAITSVENCIMTLSSPSTMLPMNGCRTCVRSVDERCEQYSETALTAEIWTHGGWDGFTPATVACRNLQKISWHYIYITMQVGGFTM